MEPKSARLDWLQTLRGVAALMVVLVHSRFILQDTPAGKAVADAVFYPMAMGVDIFFLISGFLMVLTTSNFDGSRRYACTFVIKRMARIWPVFAIVSLAVVAIEHKGIHGFRDPAVMGHMLEGLLFLPHDPVASPLYFMMFVDVAWTLCFEFYFYVIFGLSMLLGRYRYWALAVWFAVSLIGVPMLRGGFTLNLFQPDPLHMLRYPNLAISPIVWDFVLGMLAAWIYKSGWAIRSRAVIYLAMGLIVSWMIVQWGPLHFANFHGPQGWAAPLAVVFLGIVLLAKLGEVRVPAWSVWLGGISYSLYLTHLYVFAYVTKFAAWAHVAPEKSVTFLMVARPFAAIVVAYFVYRFIEGPTSDWMRERLMRLFFGTSKRTHGAAPSDPAAASPP